MREGLGTRTGDSSVSPCLVAAHIGGLVVSVVVVVVGGGGVIVVGVVVTHFLWWLRWGDIRRSMSHMAMPLSLTLEGGSWD